MVSRSQGEMGAAGFETVGLTAKTPSAASELTEKSECVFVDEAATKSLVNGSWRTWRLGGYLFPANSHTSISNCKRGVACEVLIARSAAAMRSMPRAMLDASLR